MSESVTPAIAMTIRAMYLQEQANGKQPIEAYQAATSRIRTLAESALISASEALRNEAGLNHINTQPPADPGMSIKQCAETFRKIQSGGGRR